MGVIFEVYTVPDSKVHGANMGPTWVLSVPDGPHVGPMNLATRVANLLLFQCKFSQLLIFHLRKYSAILF